MFGDTKQKYVRLKEYDQIIIFPQVMKHSIFEYLKPISAGFCNIGDGMVVCYGESFSLGIKGKEDDSSIATGQVFGRGCNNSLPASQSKEFKVGAKIKIEQCIYGHKFILGTVVEIIGKNNTPAPWLCQILGEVGTWWISEEEASVCT